MRIDVISDVICPWCFIGKRHMETALSLLAEDGLTFTVGFRPFQLNPDMPEDGVAREQYRIKKFGSLERSQELDANVASAGLAAGIAFDFARIQRTPNTARALRLVQLAGPAGVQHAVKEALMAAYFLEGRDIAAADVLADIAHAHSLDPAQIDTDTLRTETTTLEDAARQAGINGVPSFVMNGYLLFSGAMAPAAMADRFRHAHAFLSTRAA